MATRIVISEDGRIVYDHEIESYVVIGVDLAKNLCRLSYCGNREELRAMQQVASEDIERQIKGTDMLEDAMKGGR